MAWRTKKVEEQKKEFIDKFLSQKHNISDLCKLFEISRPTGYKWINRYKKEGDEGLRSRSSAPKHQPNKISQEIETLILEIKCKYMKMGPRKIAGYLKYHHRDISCPSDTTIKNLLKKNNLIVPRKYRKRIPVKTAPLSHAQAPNDVWCIDFKGWFMTKDGLKCDPLTITDAYSRYILYCKKLPFNNSNEVWKVLETLFIKYGLPKYLRHDNGPPFATCGAGRISSLSILTYKAGVIPEWIEPGCPYQNGRHERMHSTLKQECAFPLTLTLKEQQMKFSEFIDYFNNVRPHEALGQNPPCTVYSFPSRVWDRKFKNPIYLDAYAIRKVSIKGQISWKGKEIFIGKALKNECLGVKDNGEDGWSVFYGEIYLGILNEDGEFIIPHKPQRKKTKYKCRVY